MNRAYWAIFPAILLAGCSTPATTDTTTASASNIPINQPVTYDAKGLEAVMGKDVATLKGLFGEPRLDLQEAVGRKLQFTGNACILDTYLYPDGKSGQEVVTHVDARRSDGAEVDRAACVDALRRK